LKFVPRKLASGVSRRLNYATHNSLSNKSENLGLPERFPPYRAADPPSCWAESFAELPFLLRSEAEIPASTDDFD
jgi:hypothetical protein